MTTSAPTIQKRQYPGWLAPVLAFLLLAAPLMGISGFLAQRQAAGDQSRIAFSAANNLYTTGQFALAQQAYRQMQAQGVESVELLYNLALTQIQLSDGSGAVTTLLEARELAPRDVRLEALLTQATTLANGQGATLADVEPPLLPLQKTEHALLALILWTVAGALAVIAILAKKSAIRVMLFIFSFLAAVGALTMLLLA